MNPYENIIEQHKITKLCHFTKSSNLPFILGDGGFDPNGILSTELVKETNYLEILDKRRFDHKENYVCCSVQQINEPYFKVREMTNAKDLFHEWAILYIDPSVINDTSLFCPVNAATRSGRYIQSGPNSFETLFAQQLTWTKSGNIRQQVSRPDTLPANLPTNEQAEVLINQRIPLEKIIGIGFPAAHFEAEVKRMQFWYRGNLRPVRLDDM